MRKKKDKKELTKSEVKREVGRVLALGYVDHQQIRISEMNRIRDIIRKRNEGIAFDQVEKKKEESDKYSKEYTDEKLVSTISRMQKEGKLNTEETEYINKVMEMLQAAAKEEVKYKALLKQYIESEPIYTEFLQYIKGCGEIITANLIKNFGYCEKYRYVSSLWSHVGFGVVDGKAPKLQKGQKLNFNPKFRTFCWRIGDSFIKQRTPVYRQIYDGEKSRQLQLLKNKAPKAPASLMHADLRARRKMVKIFLEHYWVKSRKLQGLEVTKPWPHERAGHKSYIDVDDVISKAKALKLKKQYGV